MVWFENSIIVMAKVQEKQKKHDKYCWKCCGEHTTLKCSSCIRTFHNNCAPAAQTNDMTPLFWKCPVCIKLNNAENSDKKSDLAMLPILIDKVLKDKSFNLLKNPLTGTNYSESIVAESIVHPMNLTRIKEKINEYNSFDQFLADIQWIAHNCFILCLDNHEKMEIATSLVDYLEVEIESIKKCAECYSNEYNYPDTHFTMVCNEPHLIVWAKKKGFNFWPAKLMSIDGQLINVRFFNDHKAEDVPTTNCFLYSHLCPNRQRNSCVSYKSALKETDVYVQNARKKFGSFNFIETKMAFNPSLLEKYIAQVIPELAKSSTIKSIRTKLTGVDQKRLIAKPKIADVRQNERSENKRKSDNLSTSPRKNVVINLTRLSNEKIAGFKRHKIFSSDTDEPNDKRQRLITSTPKLTMKNVRSSSENDATKADQMDTKNDLNSTKIFGESIEKPDNTRMVEKSDENVKPVVRRKSSKIEKSKEPDVKLDIKLDIKQEMMEKINNAENVEMKMEIHDDKIESVGQGDEIKEQAQDVKDKSQEDTDQEQMISHDISVGAEITCTDEESTMVATADQSDIADQIVDIIHEPTSSKDADEFDWTQLMRQNIEETIKSMTVNMYTVIQTNMQPSFETFSKKLQQITAERDQAALAAKQLHLKLNGEHARQIAEINEKHALAIGNAKRDATTFWTIELEKIKSQAANDAEEANRTMQEKLTEAQQQTAKAEENLAKAQDEHAKETDNLNQMLFDLREQHKNELADEKQRTAEVVEMLEKTHAAAIVEMEKKIQCADEAKSTIELQLKAKYKDIITGIKEQAEAERHVQSICNCCKKPLEPKRLCSVQCEEMWSIWNNSSASEKTL